MKTLSIVAPCFNEEACIEEFHRVLSGVLDRLPYRCEILFVDDGSSDRTFSLAVELCARDDRVRVISFSRNFGHQAALLAGLEAARGDAVVTMDTDLQHPPALIPDLAREWENGFDIVSALRRNTADATLAKRVTSRGFYWLLGHVSNVQVVPSADFRLMDRSVVESFLTLRETHRFTRGLIGWLGFRTATVPFDAPARFAGKTKFSSVKMARFALHALVSFSAFPLRVTLFLGLVMAVFALIYLVYALHVYFVRHTVVPGWTSLLVTVLLIGGVQLICLGLVGEYIGKIFEEVKRRPLYLVRRREGFPENRNEHRSRTDG